MYRQIRSVFTGQIDPDFVTRLADGWCIPATCPDNRDCRVYQAWLAAGNVPHPPVDVPVDDTPTLEEKVNALIMGDTGKIAEIKQRMADSDDVAEVSEEGKKI